MVADLSVDMSGDITNIRAVARDTWVVGIKKGLLSKTCIKPQKTN